MIDRATGRARSFKVDAVDGRTIIPIIRKNIAKETVMMTDDAGHYKHLGAGLRAMRSCATQRVSTATA